MSSSLSLRPTPTLSLNLRLSLSLSVSPSLRLSLSLSLSPSLRLGLRLSPTLRLSLSLSLSLSLLQAHQHDWRKRHADLAKERAELESDRHHWLQDRATSAGALSKRGEAARGPPDERQEAVELRAVQQAELAADGARRVSHTGLEPVGRTPRLADLRQVCYSRA